MKPFSVISGVMTVTFFIILCIIEMDLITRIDFSTYTSGDVIQIINAFIWPPVMTFGSVFGYKYFQTKNNEKQEGVK